MRRSRWTQVYWDADDDGKLFAYIRLTPDFMDLEDTGFPHGISISGNRFTTEKAANAAADLYDKFFEAMLAELLEEGLPTTVQAACCERQEERTEEARV